MIFTSIAWTLNIVELVSHATHGVYTSKAKIEINAIPDNLITFRSEMTWILKLSRFAITIFVYESY